MDCWTSMKLSRIDLPATKALWFASTMDGLTGASSDDNAMAKILAKLWIRLIGLKSFI